MSFLSVPEVNLLSDISPRIKSFSTPDLRTEQSVSFLSVPEVNLLSDISPRIKSFSTPDLRTEQSVSFLSATEVSAIARGAGHHLQGLACRAQSMGTFAGPAGCGPVYQPFVIVNGPVDHVTVYSIV